MVDKFEIEGRFKGPKRPLYSSSMVYIIELDHMELIGAKKKLQIFAYLWGPQEVAIISPIITRGTMFHNDQLPHSLDFTINNNDLKLHIYKIEMN